MSPSEESNDSWRERVAERERQRAEFVGTVSHDLKTPLNAIVGFTSVLLADATGLQPEQARQLRLVQESARSLLARLNALLEFQRLEAGRIALQPEWFLPDELLLQAIDQQRPAAGDRGVRLELESNGAPRRLLADGRLVRRVLDGLLANAVRFGGPGECRLVLLTEPGAPSGRRRVRFEVCDPGGGPAPERLEALRQALDRQTDPLERPYRGLGLGLALAREAARRLGGWIELEAGAGRQTRFALVLELDAADVEE